MTVGLGTGSTVAHLLAALAARRPDDSLRRNVAARPRRGRASSASTVESFGDARSSRHRDRRRRPGRARRLAREGRRRRAHAREDRGGRGRSVRRDRRLDQAGRRVARADSASSCSSTGSPATLRRLGDGEAARRAAQPRRRRDRRLPRRRSTIRRALAARLSATPGVVEHGLFPPEMVPTIFVARGDDVEHRDCIGLTSRRAASSASTSERRGLDAAGGDRRSPASSRASASRLSAPVTSQRSWSARASAG